MFPVNIKQRCFSIRLCKITSHCLHALWENIRKSPLQYEPMEDIIAQYLLDLAVTSSVSTALNQQKSNSSSFESYPYTLLQEHKTLFFFQNSYLKIQNGIKALDY
ncbi:hypothetical protein CEXT_680241 [Caerostris extrusa]|uniref:Uncharacterized protein n=1 Tax=Caerostris extrusa TaxID=172846 RepID=A0AAV4T781_CAEEX|nr:hypothetical protein CEXT_680241 [Caerostris extrusa]